MFLFHSPFLRFLFPFIHAISFQHQINEFFDQFPVFSNKCVSFFTQLGNLEKRGKGFYFSKLKKKGRWQNGKTKSLQTFLEKQSNGWNLFAFFVLFIRSKKINTYMIVVYMILKESFRKLENSLVNYVFIFYITLLKFAKNFFSTMIVFVELYIWKWRGRDKGLFSRKGLIFTDAF